MSDNSGGRVHAQREGRLHDAETTGTTRPNAGRTAQGGAASILTMQRMAGNSAVRHMLTLQRRPDEPMHPAAAGIPVMQRYSGLQSLGAVALDLAGGDVAKAEHIGHFLRVTNFNYEFAWWVASQDDLDAGGLFKLCAYLVKDRPNYDCADPDLLDKARDVYLQQGRDVAKAGEVLDELALYGFREDTKQQVEEKAEKRKDAAVVIKEQGIDAKADLDVTAKIAKFKEGREKKISGIAGDKVTLTPKASNGDKNAKKNLDTNIKSVREKTVTDKEQARAEAETDKQNEIEAAKRFLQEEQQSKEAHEALQTAGGQPDMARQLIRLYKHKPTGSDAPALAQLVLQHAGDHAVAAKHIDWLTDMTAGNVLTLEKTIRLYGFLRSLPAVTGPFVQAVAGQASAYDGPKLEAVLELYQTAPDKLTHLAEVVKNTSADPIVLQIMGPFIASKQADGMKVWAIAQTAQLDASRVAGMVGILNQNGPQAAAGESLLRLPSLKLEDVIDFAQGKVNTDTLWAMQRMKAGDLKDAEAILALMGTVKERDILEQLLQLQADRDQLQQDLQPLQGAKGSKLLTLYEKAPVTDPAMVADLSKLDPSLDVQPMLDGGVPSVAVQGYLNAGWKPAQLASMCEGLTPVDTASLMAYATPLKDTIQKLMTTFKYDGAVARRMKTENILATETKALLAFANRSGVGAVQAVGKGWTNPLGLEEISDERMGHFMYRHRYQTFDFTDIKGQNSVWPSTKSPDDVLKHLRNTLGSLKDQKFKAPFAGDKTGQTAGSGLTATIGPTLGSNYVIGRYYPDGGTDVKNYTRAEMRRFADALGFNHN
ncbi:hypothetical protein [Paenibacillus methanolicus]|uniref:Uncharacterized protein n=1 Tax=Paenibacillus methanolicus TaxID=582686 RepID=A0A5S5C851_9BACL|nr:hypothetical protein [Paenibacillus methanolicus]TYP74566.1 hypothetical protein BCM02_105110 [Paenibacillus methanolicus]